MTGRGSDTPRVAWPDEASIRQHVELDHGFGALALERLTPSLLVYQHANAHRQFSSFRSLHRHYTAARDYGALTDVELADRLDRLVVDSAAGDVLAEAARRLRALRPTSEEAPIEP